MGQAQSQSLGIDPSHQKIWIKLVQIRDPVTRASTLETVLSGTEYIQSAKRAGVYSHCLNYITTVKQGRQPLPLPGEELAIRSHVVHQQQQYPPQIQYVQQQPQQQLVQHKQYQTQRSPYQAISKPKSSEKALNFFTACLRVLDIQEEVQLTDEILRKAYKKAALRAHPDKGGTDEQLQAVTKAYAYLSDILRIIQGQKARTEGTVDMQGIQESRAKQTADLSHVEPVRLNPKNLNLTAFNQMFEQTRVPDPDEDGYGDWLTTTNQGGKDGSASSLKDKQKFGKDFNREVFNRMFEEDQRSRYQQQNSQAITVHQPQALILSQSAGVELGRDRPPDYTAAYDSHLKYTDLKQAYTRENVISDKVAGVKAEARDYESYRSSREKAPAAYSAEENAALAAYEYQQQQREKQRQLRAAQEMISANDFHERMKRLVITHQ